MNVRVYFYADSGPHGEWWKADDDADDARERAENAIEAAIKTKRRLP